MSPRTPSYNTAATCLRDFRALRGHDVFRQEGLFDPAPRRYGPETLAEHLVLPDLTFPRPSEGQIITAI
jgi:hypothetical protein